MNYISQFTFRKNNELNVYPIAGACPKNAQEKCPQMQALQNAPIVSKLSLRYWTFLLR